MLNDYKHAYDQRGAIEMFDQAVLHFEMAAEQKEYKVTKPPTENQVKYDHINRYISKANKRYSVKVIASKRIGAWDADTQTEWIWVELHGVRERDPGWLYGGKASLLAFEQSDFFIVVHRAALQKLIPIIVREKEVDNVSLAEYAIYSRPGRHDKMTLIQARDLYKINYKLWRF